MSSKLNAIDQPPQPPHADRAILDFSCLRVSGADAAAFLQRQTMNDVRAVRVGDGQRSGVLSAKGRVLSLFVLVRRDDQEFCLVCPDRDRDYLRAELQRFVLRSKLRIEADDALRVMGHRQPAENTPGAVFAWDAGRSLSLLQAEDAASDAEFSHTWRSEDIRQGIVHLAASARDSYTPHMLGLARWRAFSLSKGCYPGQEIVARTHYLGQAKRVLWRLTVDEPLAAGSGVFAADGRELGRTLCESLDGSSLAVLPSELPDALLDAERRSLQAVAFPNEA